MTTNKEEYESLKKKALEQFRTGKPLLGKDGAFAPLLKQFLESALSAEMEELKQLAEVFDIPDHELLNSDTNVFNFTNNKNANGYAIYELSVELYQETIAHLKSEIEINREEKKYLLAIIEKLSK